MGWTEYAATEFDKNGRISKRREIIKEVTGGLAKGFEFVDGSMVGSTYYAAIRDTRDERVFCAVYLTGTRDNYWFGYKGISEIWKPYEHTCPDRILDILTPTDDDWANEWREECREYNRMQKSPHSFKNLPEGTRVKWIAPFSSNAFENGEVLTLRKGRRNPWKKRSKFVWFIEGRGYHMSPSMVREYEVIA